MAGRVPEERVALPLVSQRWRNVSFVHWPVDPDDLARVLPDELSPDLVDGVAWVAITPFVVEDFRALGVLPSPFGSAFPETNVRTYVRDRDGVEGLWFLSIDVPNVANVLGGRVLAVPYHVATMSVDGGGAPVRYRCQRRGTKTAGHDITVVPGEPVQPDEKMSLLTGRWRAFSRVAGRLITVPVQHEPWPLRNAELTALDESLLAAAGLPAPSADPIVHFSEGVTARLGRPRLA